MKGRRFLLSLIYLFNSSGLSLFFYTMFRSAVLTIAVTAISVVTAAKKPASNDFSSYLTRPGQYAVDVKVVVNNSPESLAPGYIFLAPYLDVNSSFPNGPQIFTQDGVRHFILKPRF